MTDIMINMVGNLFLVLMALATLALIGGIICLMFYGLKMVIEEWRNQ